MNVVVMNVVALCTLGDFLRDIFLDVASWLTGGFPNGVSSPSNRIGRGLASWHFIDAGSFSL